MSAQGIPQQLMAELRRNLPVTNGVLINMDFLKESRSPDLTKIKQILVVILSLFSFAFVASAQQSAPTATAVSAQPSTTTEAAVPSAASNAVKATTNAVSPQPVAPVPNSTRTPAVKPVDEYKNSLNSLLALYEQDVQRLEKENTQLKELFKDGLVARNAVEASDKALADARAKVDGAHNQIAEANKPAVVPVVSDNILMNGPEVAWSTGNTKIDNLIKLNGNRYGVDPYLIFCLMSQESGFTSGATSNKGAQGLMQLMPGTAARYGVVNPYDVSQSIMGGTRYLKDLLMMFNGRVDLALAGYNAGEGAVIKYNYKIPPYAETQNYVRVIGMRYTRGKVKTLTKPAS